jgi:hypothetical protein
MGSVLKERNMWFIQKKLHLQCILTFQLTVDWPRRWDSNFFIFGGNLGYMLQWLVDVLWVEWICSLLDEGCTSSRNLGPLIVVCGCWVSFCNGAGDELCTCVCVVIIASCHQNGKSLNLLGKLEHLLCRFST